MRGFARRASAIGVPCTVLPSGSAFRYCGSLRVEGVPPAASGARRVEAFTYKYA